MKQTMAPRMPQKKPLIKQTAQKTESRAQESDGIGANSAESSYYTWVDQHNTFGSATTSRSPPAISMTAWWRSRTAR
jgi:hypothetical protein